MTTTDETLTLAEAIDKARGGADLMVKCPAHEDGTASLHVTPAGNNVLLRCMALCETDDILKAVNLEWSALFSEDTAAPDNNNWTPKGPASDIYPYFSANGVLLYEVLRVPQASGRKTFFQRRPSGDPDKPYIWKLDDIPRVLYRLPQIIEAVRKGETIYIPEGEKDVRTLVKLGLAGTCNAGGAGKWIESYSETLSGANVVLISDADTPGRAHTRMVREQLLTYGCTVEIREAPAPYKDVSALVEAGGAITQLLVSQPADETDREKFGIDVLDIIKRTISPTEWIIPGTFARKERLIITGFEGQGKSQLLRQIAVMLGAGFNPWQPLTRIEPCRVLYIDGENEPNQTLASWQWLIELARYWDQTGQGLEKGMLTVLEEWDNSDLDLAAPEGTAWLHERVHAYQPDVVLLGPLTNVVGRDTKDDEPVRRLKRAVNSARSICGSGFIMEHHAPHKGPSDKRRSIRPYGSSMFLKWPDYGFGLLPDHEREEGHYTWERFRWPRVRNRNWPAGLRWGVPEAMEWPWMEDEPA